MSKPESGQIASVMQEERLFPPSEEFSANARIGSKEDYLALYERAQQDPQGFWGELGLQELHWFEPFTKVFQQQGSDFSWFLGGKTNVSYNCLDAHIEAGNGDRTAIIWEGEPGDTRTLTYRGLHREVCKFANVLKSLGVGTGDVVSIYMPMTPELAKTHIVRVGVRKYTGNTTHG